MKLYKLGEREIVRRCIELIRKYLQYEYNDVHYLKIHDRILAINIEGYTFSRWKLEFTTWYDCGWRAVAGCISDLIAKICRPISISISISLNSNEDFENLEELIRGILDFCTKHNIEISKIDTNEGIENSITIAGIGMAKREIPLKCYRDGIIMTKPIFGYTGLVFHLNYRGVLNKYIDNEVVRRGLSFIKKPMIDFNIVNILEQYVDRIIASSDVSDGLGATLWNIAEYSRCCIRIDTLPTTSDIISFCQENNIDILEVVFNGGEEYVPVFIVDKNDRELIDILQDLGFIIIGSVSMINNVQVFYRDVQLKYRGWQYFIGYT